jgi:hypothetical protein
MHETTQETAEQILMKFDTGEFNKKTAESF